MLSVYLIAALALVFIHFSVPLVYYYYLKSKWLNKQSIQNMDSNTSISNHSKHREPMDKGDCLGEAGEELAITLRDPIS